MLSIDHLNLFIRDAIQGSDQTEPTLYLALVEPLPRATIRAKELVLAEWQKTLFLRSESPESRGWLLDVMKCVESLGKREFTLDEVYAFERHLSELYPGNQNVRPKIRQQLQYLRDRGFIEFVSRGNYRLR